MKTHRFTLILAGVRELTPDLADSLFEATHGDIELNMRDGVAYVDFQRSAASLHEAVASGIQDVESAETGVRVVRVESDTANTIAKINAELLGTVAKS